MVSTKRRSAAHDRDRHDADYREVELASGGA
jgi:hypothetical protein